MTSSMPDNYVLWPVFRSTEFLNLTLAVKSVSSVEEAIEHINSHGSHHTDVILTANAQVANRFMNAVDSAGEQLSCKNHHRNWQECTITARPVLLTGSATDSALRLGFQQIAFIVEDLSVWKGC